MFSPQAIVNSNGAKDWLIPNETWFQTERQWHMFINDKRYQQQSNETYIVTVIGMLHQAQTIMHSIGSHGTA